MKWKEWTWSGAAAWFAGEEEWGSKAPLGWPDVATVLTTLSEPNIFGSPPALWLSRRTCVWNRGKRASLSAHCARAACTARSLPRPYESCTVLMSYFRWEILVGYVKELRYVNMYLGQLQWPRWFCFWIWKWFITTLEKKKGCKCLSRYSKENKLATMLNFYTFIDNNKEKGTFFEVKMSENLKYINTKYTEMIRYNVFTAIN